MKKIILYKPELSGLIDFDDFKIQCNKAEYALNNGETIDITALIESPPISFIMELVNSKFLSLFECIFLISYAIGNKNMLNYSAKIAYIEIEKGIISPRDSDTNLMLNDLTLPKDMDGNPIPILPDLLSTLSFKEADQWANKTFHTSLKDLRDSLPAKLPADIQATKQDELTETERNTLLRLVIGMAIDAYGYDPNKSRNSATGDKNGISAKLQARGISISDETIRKYLTEAKNLL